MPLHQIAALPWRIEKDGSVSVLLITSRTNGKWMLPKGWPMEGKTDAEAASIEARQEAGLEGRISEYPIGSYRFIMVLDDGATEPSQAIIYSLQVSKAHRDWKEKGQRRRKWFAPRKAAAVAFEPDLARFLHSLAAGRIVLS
jgi:8-oxo-dGTP pyrophosphatase MutT (NUDIX family)